MSWFNELYDKIKETKSINSGSKKFIKKDDSTILFDIDLDSKKSRKSGNLDNKKLEKNIDYGRGASDTKKEIKTEKGKILIENMEYINHGSYGYVYKTIYTLDEDYTEKNVIIKITNDKYEYDIGKNFLKTDGTPKCDRVLGYIDRGEEEYKIKNTKYRYIIVYEYMNKLSLKKYLDENVLSMENYLRILNRVYSIYKCLIENGYTYIDLKPSNILLNDYFGKINVYLGDIGGIKTNDKIMRNINKYVSTYNRPLKKATYGILMSWEFLIFSLMIHPVLKEGEYKTFLWSTETEIYLPDDFLNNFYEETYQLDYIYNHIITKDLDYINMAIGTVHIDPVFDDSSEFSKDMREPLIFCRKIINIFENAHKHSLKGIEKIEDKKIIFDYKKLKRK